LFDGHWTDFEQITAEYTRL